MTGGVSDFHREVVAVVLPVLTGHGFALAGGNALLAHGISTRPTRDVNLFTDRKGAVPAVAAAVETALRTAGFYAERIDTFSGLLVRFPETADLQAEWTVARGGTQVMLQLATNDQRQHAPVTMELGPVLGVEDVLAAKVLALIDRIEVRDAIDVSMALGRFSAEELISLAWAMEPGYDYADFTGIGPAVELMDDTEFLRYGLDAEGIAELRRRFAAWPRRADPG